MTNAPVTAGVPPIEPRHRLRIALEYADVSIGEMAETLGASRNTIGNYLSGRSTPRLPTLRVWAMRCGVPLEWIRYGIATADGDDGGPNLGSTPTACNADIIPFPTRAPLARTA